MSTPVATLKMITPAVAKRMLTYNHGNRNIRATWVSSLARIIESGQWVPNNDAIVLATGGNLLNGQHRLRAIVESGIAVQMVVMEGADPAAFATMDCGSRRTMADRTGRPTAMTADASLLNITLNGHNFARQPTATDIDDICDWWQPAYEAIVGATQGIRRGGFDNASVRTGFGVRWAVGAAPLVREHTLSQYAAMLRNDTPAMDRSIATLWQRLTRSRVPLDRLGRVRLAAEVFYCTDPVKRDVAPLIKSPEEVVATFTARIAAMPAAFMAGPAATGHPYAWGTPASVTLVKRTLKPATPGVSP